MEDLKKLHNQYTSLGYTDSLEQFTALKEQMGEEPFNEFITSIISDDLKKKDQTNLIEESGISTTNPNLTSNPSAVSTPISNEMDLLPIQEQMDQQQVELHQNSLESATTQPMLSTELGLENGVSSSTESSQDNEPVYPLSATPLPKLDGVNMAEIVNGNNEILGLNLDTPPNTNTPATNIVGGNAVGADVKSKTFNEYNEGLKNYNNEIKSIDNHNLIKEANELLKQSNSIVRDFNSISKDPEFSKLKEQRDRLINQINSLSERVGKDENGKTILNKEDYNLYENLSSQIKSIESNPKFLNTKNKLTELDKQLQPINNQYDSIVNSGEYKSLSERRKQLVSTFDSVRNSKEYNEAFKKSNSNVEQQVQPTQVDNKSKVDTTPAYQFDTTNEYETTKDGKVALLEDGTKKKNRYYGLEQVQGDFSKTNEETGVTKTIGKDVEGIFKDATGNIVVSVDRNLYDIDDYLNPDKAFIPDEDNRLYNINGIALPKAINEIDKPKTESINSLYEFKPIELNKEFLFTLGVENGYEIDKINKDLLKLEQQGLVKISRVDGKIKEDDKTGSYFASIVDKNYLDEYNAENLKRYNVSDYDQAKNYSIQNDRILNPIYENVAFQKEADQQFIEKHGQKLFNKYGNIPDSEVQAIKDNEDKQRIIQAGYSEEDANKYVNEWKENKLNRLRTNAINALDDLLKPKLDKRDSEFVVGAKEVNSPVFTDGQKEKESNYQAFRKIALAYPKQFVDFLLKNLDYDVSSPENAYMFKNSFFRYLKEDTSYQYARVKDLANEQMMEVKKNALNRDIENVKASKEKLNSYKKQLEEQSKFFKSYTDLENEVAKDFKKEQEKIQKLRELKSESRSGYIGAKTEILARGIADVPLRFIGDWATTVLTYGGASRSTLDNVDNWSNYFSGDNRSMTDEVVEYTDKKGNKYELVNGSDLFAIKDGKRTIETSDYNPQNFISKNELEETNKYSDFNWNRLFVEVAKVGTDIALAGSASKAISSTATPYMRLLRLKSGLSEGNTIRKGIDMMTKFIANPSTLSSYGMAVQYAGHTVKNYEEKGYTPLQARALGVFSTIMLANVNRIFPDIKLLEQSDDIATNAYRMIAAGERQSQSAKSFIIGKLKEYSVYGREFTGRTAIHTAQENLEESVLEPVVESIVQGMGAVISGGRKQWHNIESPFDFSKETMGTTTGYTFLTSLFARGRGNINFNNTTPLQRTILFSKDTEYLKFLDQMQNDVIIGNAVKREIDALNTTNKYLKSLPKDNNLNIGQTEQVIIRLQKIEELKKDLANSENEAIKDELQNQINALNIEIGNVFEQSKSNPNPTDETEKELPTEQQPTEATQPEEEQEVVQAESGQPFTLSDTEQPASKLTLETLRNPLSEKANIQDNINNNLSPTQNESTQASNATQGNEQQQATTPSVEPTNTPNETDNASVQANQEAVVQVEQPAETPPQIFEEEVSDDDFTNEDLDNFLGSILRSQNEGIPNASSETDGEVSPTDSRNSSSSNVKKINDTDVNKINLTRLNTDEKRFQGRNQLNETIVSNIAKNWSDANQDPIHIWRDPKDKKFYVLSGHHRYYGAKRGGVKQVKVIDRSGDFTEQEAIKFAKEEANANRSMETPLERAITLRSKRERNDPKEEIDAFLNLEGRNSRLVNNLSHLKPNGKTAQSMRQFEGTSNSDSKRETEKIGDWIGEARRLFGNRLTDAHENEMYDFLSNKEASKRFTNKADFIEKVRNLVGTLDYDSSQPLNLKRVQQKGDGEREYEKQIEELKRQASDYDNRISDLDKRFTNPNKEDYINPESKDFAELKERARQEKRRLKSEQEVVYKKIDALQRQKGNYVKADIKQGRLFDFQKGEGLNAKKIPKNVFEKVVNKFGKAVKGFFKNHQVTYDWNEFVKRHKALGKYGSIQNAFDSERIRETNARFNQQLEQLKKQGVKFESHFLDLGMPLNILKAVGFPDVKITIGKNTLLNSSQKNNGRYDLSDLNNLVKAINNPLVVFENPSEKHPNRRGMLIDLSNGKRNFLVVVELNDTKDGVELNSVVSVHPRNFNNFVNWINNKNILYTDKKKTLQWLSSPLVESKKDSHSDNAQPARFNANLSQKIETARDKIQNFENPISDKEVGDVHNTFDSERMHEESKKVNKEFNRRLDEIEQGKLGKPLSLGMPNAILRNAGIENKEMKIFGSKIISKLNKHGYRAKDLTNLPNAVQAPIAVFKGSQEGSFAILTEIDIKGKKVLVSVSKGKGDFVDINFVSSVYPKNEKSVINWINNNLLLYVNKQKMLDYLHNSTPIVGTTSNLTLDNATNIIQNFDNPISDKEVGDVQFMVGASNETPDSLYNKYGKFDNDILTDETKEDDGTIIRLKLIPKFETHWHNEDSSDPTIESFDNLSDALEDTFIEGDTSENTYAKPYKELIVSFQQEWVDEDGDYWDSGDDVSYEDVKNYLPANLQGLNYGIIHTENFESNEDEENKKRQELNILPDVQTSVARLLKGKKDFRYERAGFLGKSHYYYWTSDNGNRVLLRISDHNFKADNLLSESNLEKNKAGDIAYPDIIYSIVIQNDNARIVTRDGFYKSGEINGFNGEIHQTIYDINDIESIGNANAFTKIIEENLDDIEKGGELPHIYGGVSFMHTPNGQVYGAKLPDGTIYFNPELLNMDTAFHEFSHLWEQMMPRAWAKGLALFKQTKTGKELFSKLKGEGNYSNLTDEQLWSEAMNIYIGERGAELYENKPRGVMAQFREWLSDLFYKLGQAFGIKKPMTPFTTFEEFAHRVIDDIQGGRELLGENHIPKSEIPNIIRAMSNADLEMMLLDMGVIEKGKCA